MKILISTFGVRGDVQPYLALAVGLQAAGHRVTLATSQNFTAWIESYGVHAHPTSFNFQEAMQQPEAQAIVQGKNFPRQLRLLREAMNQSPAAQESAWAAIQEADLVVQSPTGVGALEAASQRGIPVAFASPVPFTPTRAFPSFNMASLRFSLGGRYNLLTHKLAQRMMWNVMGSPMSAHLRTKLGLQPWRSYNELLAYARSVAAPWLYGFSAHVLPKPADWDETQHVTGYWFLDAPPGWAPDPDLLRFLESGPPPVYIGFGSMSFMDPEGQTQLALRALELSGQRGVVLTSSHNRARQAAPPSVFWSWTTCRTPGSSRAWPRWCITAAPAPRARVCGPACPTSSHPTRPTTSRRGPSAWRGWAWGCASPASSSSAPRSWPRPST
jgi:sterol 3beta-glucosyltransferase